MKTVYYFCTGCRQTFKRRLPDYVSLRVSLCGVTGFKEKVRKSRAKNPAKLAAKTN
jgi:hypothetical protein